MNKKTIWLKEKAIIWLGVGNQLVVGERQNKKGEKRREEEAAKVIVLLSMGSPILVKEHKKEDIYQIFWPTRRQSA